MQNFLQKEEEKQWGDTVSYLINDNPWLGQNGKEAGDFIMLLSSIIFIIFTIPVWFPSSPAPSCRWMFEGKAEWRRLLCRVQFVILSENFLTSLAESCYSCYEKWARAPALIYTSRKIIVSREQLRSCSTARWWEDRRLSVRTDFMLFKLLYVRDLVSFPYVAFVGN